MATLLTPQLVAMMARGVSVIVGSRDVQMRPSIMRAVGSRVAPDGSAITVYLAREQSRQLLQDIAATGHVAVVFSQPATHCTMQVKARQAGLRRATADDAPVLAAYLAAMEQEIQAVGYPPAVTRAMLAHRLDEAVASRCPPRRRGVRGCPQCGAPPSGWVGAPRWPPCWTRCPTHSTCAMPWCWCTMRRRSGSTPWPAAAIQARASAPKSAGARG